MWRRQRAAPQLGAIMSMVYAWEKYEVNMHFSLPSASIKLICCFFTGLRLGGFAWYTCTELTEAF
jgi:hypothetical protein